MQDGTENYGLLGWEECRIPRETVASMKMVEPSLKNRSQLEKPQLLLSISWPRVARASSRTKHRSLKCQDGFLETLSLDRGTVLMAAVSRQWCFLLRAATKGMCCCVLNGKPRDTEDCNLCPTPPSAGRTLRNITRLLEPVGRDFERSEVTHSPLCK